MTAEGAARSIAAMGAIVLRLTDEMAAFVEEAAAGGGYPDAEAFIQSLLMDEHSKRLNRLHALLDQGLASGPSDRTIDDVFEDALRRHRARQA